MKSETSNIEFRNVSRGIEEVRIGNDIHGFISQKGTKGCKVSPRRFEVRVPTIGVSVDAPTKAAARQIVRDAFASARAAR